jgi:hypothetical protein
MDTQGNFYLGRLLDQKTGKAGDQPLLYEPEDLTTHGVVVGMTGSGKTGLCIGLLEEAALSGIPALMIDPKGDITNTLLHFPDLLPQDFKPWVNPDEARRADLSLDQAAAQAAESWKKGLADWGIEPSRLSELKNAAHFAVFTPGSNAGIPVSILASLNAPGLDWESNREMLREKISGTVTALLGLVGLQDIDPVRSREHILLSNIFENAWKQGQDLQLDELILQTQTPPFEKLGVFDVNTFFPEKDRFSLAMLLNNILAAPAFQTWIEGQPLDIPGLLYAEDGRPRHSVFYIAHLSDTERMFFVTLLFSAVEAWMRTQSGTTSLRALLYFDEIFGYMPPLSNPPTKLPMLRMLKQARAFGVGLVLVTQNPVDLDYKGLSNTGSWFIGKLQTERDKLRLLDGLQGALAGVMDREAYDRLIAGLGKRVFLMHNVHNKEPLVFQTRWAMNYLAGPLTRTQIPALNLLAGAVPAPAAPAAAPAPVAETAPAPQAGPPKTAQPAPAKPATAAAQPRSPGSTTRPAIPGDIAEYFLPNNLTLAEAYQAAGEAPPAAGKNLGLIYRPAVLAQARVRFLNRKYDLDHEELRSVLVSAPDRRGVVRWEDFPATPRDPSQLEDRPAPQARFAPLEVPFSDARILAALEKDFIDWAFRTIEIKVFVNEALKVYGGPDVSQAEFRTRCSKAAREGYADEAKKIEAAYAKKAATIKDRLAREKRELEQDEAEHSQRKMEEMGGLAETFMGVLGGRRSSRRLSSSLSKRRMTAQSKADVDESKETIADLEGQIAALDKEKAQALEDANNRWGDLANQVDEIGIAPLKKDVLVDYYGVAWAPYYVVQAGSETQELPAYQ